MTDSAQSATSSTSTSCSSSPSRCCSACGSTWPTPSIMWRASRRAAPDPVGGAEARGHLRGPGGLDRHHHGPRARPVRLRDVRARSAGDGAGGGQGPSPIWTPTSARHPAGPGHRPAVEVHLPVPDLRRLRDQRSWSCRSTPPSQFHVTSLDVIHSFWAYQLEREGRRQPPAGQRRLHRRPRQTRQRSPSAAASCAGSGTGPCSTTGRWCPRTQFESWATDDRGKLTPRTRNLLPPYRAAPTSPTPTAPTAGTTPTTSIPTATPRVYGATARKADSGRMTETVDDPAMTLAAERDSEVVYPDPTPPVRGGFQGLPARPGIFSQHAGHRGHRWPSGATCSATGSGNVIASGYDNVQAAGVERRRHVTAGLLLGVLGWLLGIGALNYPLAKIVGYGAPPRLRVDQLDPVLPLHRRPQGRRAAVRRRRAAASCSPAGCWPWPSAPSCSRPTSHVFGPGTYISVVSEHGTIMMMMATSVVVGPLGNWLVPLMIGSRRMAFPRVEAFSLLDLHRRLPGHPDRPCFFGGFPTGWTGLRPAPDPGRRRAWMSYLVGFAVIGIGMIDGRLQPGRHHHQLPGPGHDLGPDPDLRLGHPGHRCPPHPGHTDPGGRRPVRHPRPHRPDGLLRHRARGQHVPVAEPVLVLRPPGGLHHGPARASGSWWRSCRCSPESRCSPTGSPPPA